MKQIYQKCAQIIKNSDIMYINAGAGIGVDSGLPDYRGDKGFWNSYPMYKHLGINFIDAANPQHFKKDPHFAWGFYGHRTQLYRDTIPHQGFHLMQKFISEYNLSYFIITSNVDGQFQKAGFAEDRIYEIHGSIHHLQCLSSCRRAIWKNNETFDIDFKTMRSKQIPKCIHCKKVSRPNILMFGDWEWISDRSDKQQHRLDDFEQYQSRKNTVVLEIGAGTAIPSIRHDSERRGNRDTNVTVIRINPREPQISTPHIAINCGALEALSGIEAALKNT
ncbi:NAD-dependent deacetylase [Candidatus Uabimicrobium sp. HlEnr_7]|uniref:SIR2 family NAD-dependent protein deacylase n=1 Tax=Candidatus Uabimicrobium helgolandensis TaxID=3095367 RepID=UPI0035585E98